MKSVALFAVVMIVTSINAFAETSIMTDPFNLSVSISKVEELGVITQPEVDALGEKAKELFSTGDCQAAIPVLVEYSKKSDWLASLLSATSGLAYDDREASSFDYLNPAIPLESLSDDYINQRNIAFAMQGECLVKTGDHKGAIPVLLQSLDLIDMHNDSWWERTRNNLLQVIKVSVH